MSAKYQTLNSLSVLLFILSIGVRPLTVEAYTPFKEDLNHLRLLFNTSESNVVRDMGCRKVDQQGQEPKAESSGSKMTIVSCTKRCWGDQKLYAYVTGGDECVCSEGLTQMTVTIHCNIRCESAAAQTCGGHHAASVMFTGWMKLNTGYLNTNFVMINALKINRRDQITKTMSSHDNGKCVKWKPNKSVSFRSEIMTPTICLVNCFHNKFIYALLSMGFICKCTSETPPTVEAQEREDCIFKCKGNSRKTCGGINDVHNIFHTAHIDKTDALYRGHYFALRPLEENWLQYLRVHNLIWIELLQKGMDLAPPHRPEGYENIIAGMEEDAVVEDDKQTDDGSILIIGIAVCVVLFLCVSVFLVICFVRRSKEEVMRNREMRSETLNLVVGKARAKSKKSSSRHSSKHSSAHNSRHSSGHNSRHSSEHSRSSRISHHH